MRWTAPLQLLPPEGGSHKRETSRSLLRELILPHPLNPTSGCGIVTRL